MAPDTNTMETLIKTIKRLEQDRDTAWKNGHILERARQEQDKKFKALEECYAQRVEDNKDLLRQLASAEALIETLQEQLR